MITTVRTAPPPHAIARLTADDEPPEVEQALRMMADEYKTLMEKLKEVPDATLTAALFDEPAPEEPSPETRSQMIASWRMYWASTAPRR